MIEPTQELLNAFSNADFSGCGNADWEDEHLRIGLAAVIPLIERDLRAQIAYRIRAELVCCDIYERTHPSPAGLKASEGPHAICYWGEAAARIAMEARL